MSDVLAGRTVVVTRSRAQAAELVEALEALGADVLEFPAIEIVDPPEWESADQAARHIDGYDWVVFTSANAVDRFLARMRELGLSESILGRVRIAAVGPATAQRLLDHRLEPDLIPEDHRAEGVLAGLIERGVGPDSRVLIPRALEAREMLPEVLRERGVEVDVVSVYRTVRGPGNPEVLDRLKAGSIDAITFTSSSTVKNMFEIAEGIDVPSLMSNVLVASIGPVTSETVRKLGLTVGVEAGDSTVAGLVASLGRHYEDHVDSDGG